MSQREEKKLSEGKAFGLDFVNSNSYSKESKINEENLKYDFRSLTMTDPLNQFSKHTIQKRKDERVGNINSPYLFIQYDYDATSDRDFSKNANYNVNRHFPNKDFLHPEKQLVAKDNFEEHKFYSLTNSNLDIDRPKTKRKNDSNEYQRGTNNPLFKINTPQLISLSNHLENYKLYSRGISKGAEESTKLNNLSKNNYLFSSFSKESNNKNNSFEQNADLMKKNIVKDSSQSSKLEEIENAKISSDKEIRNLEMNELPKRQIDTHEIEYKKQQDDKEKSRKNIFDINQISNRLNDIKREKNSKSNTGVESKNIQKGKETSLSNYKKSLMNPNKGKINLMATQAFPAKKQNEEEKEIKDDNSVLKKDDVIKFGFNSNHHKIELEKEMLKSKLLNQNYISSYEPLPINNQESTKLLMEKVLILENQNKSLSNKNRELEKIIEQKDILINKLVTSNLKCKSNLEGVQLTLDQTLKEIKFTLP